MLQVETTGTMFHCVRRSSKNRQSSTWCHLVKIEARTVVLYSSMSYNDLLQNNVEQARSYPVKSTIEDGITL